jgi:radical SAM superfamily enzyme YgiQ (UPF0313 family)
MHEIGPIRPPSEAASLLIRATRNCPWNKCEFCPIYKKALFELRPVEEIIEDIDKAFYNYGDRFYSAFLQDANSLVMKTPDLAKVISHIKKKFPNIQRITSYARVRTIARKSTEDLIRLREAGLSRLHIGLESGYDQLLEYMKKGATSELAIEAGKKIKASEISLCFYIILGLAGHLKLEGKAAWRQHALHSAQVCNAVDPDFIRVRTLTIIKGMPLYEKLQKGEFEKASDIELIKEEELFIKSLEATSRFVSDHSTNVLMDIEGKLPEDKEYMLSLLKKYLSLSENEQMNFRLGTLFRACGHTPNYKNFADFFDMRKRQQINAVIREMEKNEPGSVKKLVSELRSMLV